MKILKGLLLSVFSYVLSLPVFALQDGLDGGNTGSGDEPKHIGEIGNVLDEILKYIFPAAGLLCVIFIIIGGYMWISSAGDPAKVKMAQGTLTWAIIGLVFVLLSVAIIQVIVKFL